MELEEEFAAQPQETADDPSLHSADFWEDAEEL